jgi:hypothetical protein
VRLLWPSLGLLGLLIAACYQQPTLSPLRPLRCDPAGGKAECPTGYSCAATGVCARTICRNDEECPAGLLCANRTCLPVPIGDPRDASGDRLLPAFGLDGADPDSAFPGPLDASSPDAASLPDGGLD